MTAYSEDAEGPYTSHRENRSVPWVGAIGSAGRRIFHPHGRAVIVDRRAIVQFRRRTSRVSSVAQSVIGPGKNVSAVDYLWLVSGDKRRYPHLNATFERTRAQLMVACGRIRQSREDLGKTPNPSRD
jgi:hypothetical protein